MAKHKKEIAMDEPKEPEVEATEPAPVAEPEPAASEPIPPVEPEPAPVAEPVFYFVEAVTAMHREFREFELVPAEALADLPGEVYDVEGGERYQARLALRRSQGKSLRWLMTEAHRE